MIDPEIFYPVCLALIAVTGIGLALVGLQPRRRG